MTNLNDAISTTLADIAAAHETKQRAAWREYGALVHQNNLDAKQIARVVTLMQVLGIDQSAVAVHAEALREGDRLAAIASQNNEALQEHIVASGEAAIAFSEETKRIARERQAEGARLHGEYQDALRQQRGANDARIAMLTLQQQHAALFGVERPQPVNESEPTYLGLH